MLGFVSSFVERMKCRHDQPDPLYYEEAFARYGIEPRAWIDDDDMQESKGYAEDYAHVDGLSDALMKFLKKPRDFPLQRESFCRSDVPGRIIAGNRATRAKVHLAAPGCGLIDRRFVTLLHELRGPVSPLYPSPIELQTTDGCLAARHLAATISDYHPDDLMRLYGSILADLLQCPHAHVPASGPPSIEDDMVIYIDPTGRLEDPAASGLPDGEKITVSHHQLDTSFWWRAKYLWDAYPTLPDLDFVLKQRRRHAGMPKTHIAVLDDRSFLTARMYDYAWQSVMESRLENHAKVIRLKIPNLKGW